MTPGQHVYVLALAISLMVAQPCRATVFAMTGNLAATLLALMAWDTGFFTASDSILAMMVIDLVCAAALAFAAPAIALAFGAMVAVSAFGLISGASRGVIIGLVSGLAYAQIAAILGGLGGGGGLRDYMRCARHRWRHSSDHFHRAADARGEEK